MSVFRSRWTVVAEHARRNVSVFVIHARACFVWRENKGGNTLRVRWREF